LLSRPQKGIEMPKDGNELPISLNASLGLFDLNVDQLA
jgi:hypothetical protein